MDGLRYRRVDTEIRGVVLDLEGICFDHGFQTLQSAIKSAFSAKEIELDGESLRTTSSEAHLTDSSCKIGLIRALAKEMGKHVPNGDSPVANGKRLSTAWILPHLISEFEGAYLKGVKQCKPIHGAVDAVKDISGSGVKVGVIADCCEDAFEGYRVRSEYYGFKPTVLVSTAEIQAKKSPEPWSLFHCMQKMGTFPPSSVVRVTTSVNGVQEGINAGCFVVGISRTSRYVSECASADPDAPMSKETQKRVKEWEEKLYQAGAHFVIEGVWELPRVLNELKFCRKYAHLSM